MRALILQNDATAAVATSKVLIDKGFQILCVDTRRVAETLVRMDCIDLLVMDEKVDGQLTHAIALSGERKNPYMTSILMTDRVGADTDDLYDLIPSLYALAGIATSPALVGQLALASVANLEDVQARVAQNAAADQFDEETPDDLAVVPFEASQMASLAEDEMDIPSYADIIFATPALAELSNAGHYDDDNGTADDTTQMGSDLPDLAAILAKRPLLLSEPIPDSVPA